MEIKLKFINFLFIIYPLIIFMPNVYLSMYMGIFLIVSMFLFYEQKIKIKFKFLDWLLLFLLISSLISTLININILGNFLLIKSILDFKFLLLFLVIRKLIFYKLVNLKLLFLIIFICTICLSMDIFIQHINKKNIFGFEPFDGRYNGFFEHEAIAGGYLQKFSVFALIYILTLNTKNKSALILLTIIIIGSGIILSLDRMPFIAFFFLIIVLLILVRNLRKTFFLGMVCLIFIFTFLFTNYEPVKSRYTGLKNEINFNKIFDDNKKNYTQKIDNNLLEKLEININKILIGDYYRIYKSAFTLWAENNLLIGSGTRSFSKICNIKIKDNINLICTTHPHNMYLEIMFNQGIMGLFLFLTFIISLIFILTKGLLSKYKNNYTINFLFLSIVIVEFLPFRSYGSIFSNVNGSIFWYIMALCSSINYIKNALILKY